MEEQKIIDSFTKQVPSNPTIDKPAIKTANQEAIDFRTKLDLFNHLDINMQLLSDEETNKTINDIHDWAKSMNPQMESMDMISLLTDIEGRLGRNLDKSRLQAIGEYITIDKQIKILEKRKRILENATNR